MVEQVRVVVAAIGVDEAAPPVVAGERMRRRAREREELVERQAEPGAAESACSSSARVGRRHLGQRVHQRRANVGRRVDERAVEIEADELETRMKSASVDERRARR